MKIKMTMVMKWQKSGWWCQWNDGNYDNDDDEMTQIMMMMPMKWRQLGYDDGDNENEDEIQNNDDNEMKKKHDNDIDEMTKFIMIMPMKWRKLWVWCWWINDSHYDDVENSKHRSNTWVLNACGFGSSMKCLSKSGMNASELSAFSSRKNSSQMCALILC